MAETRNYSMDALIPAEMALRAEEIGVTKAKMSLFRLFALGVLAGIFIALGAIFATTVTSPTMGLDPLTGNPAAQWLPFGPSKLIGGFTFCLGLILVVVAGAELFTGNNLIIMAWANRRISTRSVLRNWGVVYVGNFVGAILTVVVMLFSGQYEFGGGAIGLNALNIAQTKVGHGFIQAIFLGSLCNMLVCLA
ncbi:MAG: formate/nitrite transporter family protein, partial [Candidatus Promineifilaceae bacterium]